MVMPKVDINKIHLTGKDLEIFNLVVKKNGQIRATKPPVNKDDPLTGKAAYVWRLVCFFVSPKPQHHCMPVCADFDLPAYNSKGKWCARRSNEMADNLKHIENAIVNAVNKTQWHGVYRWGRALGHL